MLMEDRLHNLSAADLARQAYESQVRLKAAEDDFATCKLNLVGIASGARMDIEVPNLCRVMVIPPKLNDKRRYTVDAEKFEFLDYAVRMQLLADGVIQEARRSDEVPLPVVRVIPVTR